MGETPDTTADGGLPLISRGAEMKTIEEVAGRVADGQGAAVVICGGVGIGKTRLAEEIAHRAVDRGFDVLRGSAYPADGNLAYAPLVEALGRKLRELEPPERTKLVRGLESLGLILEDLGLASPPSLGDPALEKTRLFESMTRLLDRMSRIRPVLLLIDDLHWIDQASLQLISYVGRDLASFRVLLLGTYSAEHLEESPALMGLLRTLRRAETLTDIELRPLESDEVAALASALLGGELSPQAVDLIAEQSGGTPLFVVGLLDELVGTDLLTSSQGRWNVEGAFDHFVPPVADDIFTDRLDRLDEAERRLIEMVAVGGSEVQHDVLKSVIGVSEEDLILSVERLTSSGLIAEKDRAGSVTYKCAHPLIARVAYLHMPAVARSRAHVSFIGVLESHRRQDRGRLAWHYQRAGREVDQERRLVVLTGAGRRALDRFANEEAAENLQAALEVARDLGRPDVVTEVLEDLGKAWSRLGEERAAADAWEEGLSAHLAIGGRSSAARLHRRLALAESNLGRFDAAARHVGNGLDMLEGDPTDEHAELLAVDVLNHFRRRDIAGAASAIETFAAVTAPLGSARVDLQTAMLRVGALMEAADYERVTVEASRSLELAQTLDDPVAEQQALAYRALAHLSLGNLELLDQDLQVNLELTERVGIPLREYRIRLYQFAGDVYAGRWARAEEVAIEAALHADRIVKPRNRLIPQVMPVLLDAYRGEFERAEERLSSARNSLIAEGPPAAPISIVVEVLAALCALEQDRPEEALSIISALGGDYLPGLIPPWGLCTLGEAQARCGDEGVNHTVTLLSRLGPASSLPVAWATRIRGLASLEAGDDEEAATLLSEAVELFEALGMPFEAARARLEQAETFPEETATEGARGSHATFSRLGATRYVDRAAALLRSVGEAVPRPAVSATPGLTPRQTQVAQLVAQGLTNAEIAERLYISHRTVTTHLENIYRGLGLRSRTALTRYVVEAGLSEEGYATDT